MRLLIHLDLEDLRGLTNFCDDFNDSSNRIFMISSLDLHLFVI